METYIVRLYREGKDKEKTVDVLGVVEVAGQDIKRYFSSIDELPTIFHQLSETKSND